MEPVLSSPPPFLQPSWPEQSLPSVSSGLSWFSLWLLFGDIKIVFGCLLYQKGDHWSPIPYLRSEEGRSLRAEHQENVAYLREELRNAGVLRIPNWTLFYILWRILPKDDFAKQTSRCRCSTPRRTSSRSTLATRSSPLRSLTICFATMGTTFRYTWKDKRWDKKENWHIPACRQSTTLLWPVEKRNWGWPPHLTIPSE